MSEQNVTELEAPGPCLVRLATVFVITNLLTWSVREARSVKRGKVSHDIALRSQLCVNVNYTGGRLSHMIFVVPLNFGTK